MMFLRPIFKLFISTEKKQLKCLIDLDRFKPEANQDSVRDDSTITVEENEIELGYVRRYLLFAGILHPPVLCALFILSINCCFAFSIFYFLRMGAKVSCVLAILLLYAEWSYVASLVRKRANEFLDDFPSVLLAMASSLKAGFTPFDALIRSVESFPDNRLAKKEVLLLKARIISGCESSIAVTGFAKYLDAPEVASFQRALRLTLENGGRFVLSLERMAKSIRTRRILARSVETSTMTMRMTALALVVIGPFVVNIVSAQSPDYWESIFSDPIPSRIAYGGITLILIGLITLDRMSKFRP